SPAPRLARRILAPHPAATAPPAAASLALPRSLGFPGEPTLPRQLLLGLITLGLLAEVLRLRTAIRDGIPTRAAATTRRVLKLLDRFLVCVGPVLPRSEEHTSELQSRFELVCRLLLEKKKYKRNL